MSHGDRDEKSDVETTGHEWDGIRELDNPLPRWWLYVFYGCIVFAIGYWILMPAWPGLHGYSKGLLHRSDRGELSVALHDLSAKRGIVTGTANAAGGAMVVRGQVPLSELVNYQQRLNALTRGEGRYTLSLSHYEAVPPNMQQQLVSAHHEHDDEA